VAMTAAPTAAIIGTTAATVAATGTGKTPAAGFLTPR
jgi:hypothetical protein